MPEKEYIEREAVLNEQIEICYWNGANDIYGDFVPVEIVRSIPTADVAEVRHGEWITDKKEKLYYNDDMSGFYDYPVRCSVCKFDLTEHGYCETNYCPNCGAKMDSDNNIVESCAKVMLRLCGNLYKYCDGICKNCNEPEYHATNSIQMEADNG